MYVNQKLKCISNDLSTVIGDKSKCKWKSKAKSRVLDWCFFWKWNKTWKRSKWKRISISTLYFEFEFHLWISIRFSFFLSNIFTFVRNQFKLKMIKMKTNCSFDLVFWISISSLMFNFWKRISISIFIFNFEFHLWFSISIFIFHFEYVHFCFQLWLDCLSSISSFAKKKHISNDF